MDLPSYVIYFFLSYSLPYSFYVLYACCFGQFCLVSWRLPVPEWAKLSQDWGNFLLLFNWIGYISLWFAPLLLQWPYLSSLVFWCACWVLAYSFHGCLVVWLRIILFFHFYLILEPWDSFTFSSLLEWPSTEFYSLTIGTFNFQDFCLILSFEVFLKCGQLF
jgi:hypothetical protein